MSERRELPAGYTIEPHTSAGGREYFVVRKPDGTLIGYEYGSARHYYTYAKAETAVMRSYAWVRRVES